VYEVLIERRAERDLKRLASEAFDRVIRDIQSLGGNPRPPGCRKIVGSKNDWRVRVGDYRVVYEIDEKSKAVRVMRVRLRQQAYR